MSGKELVRLMEQNGWVVKRIEGSHHIMVKGHQTEVVPIHGNKDIPKGLLNSIMKRTGLK
ncbi:MAG: type II toxin-antitoxin system HicA family toxin [Lachnospiraceae bacterium]|nr:type II toxin-antitoxin system HicA family toxin [Lachnospiraceae bacterium]